MQVFLGWAPGNRLAALVIGMAGWAGTGAGLLAAPITYTSVNVGATGGNGTSNAQVQNGVVIYSGAAVGGTATGGGTPLHTSFANASTLTQYSSGSARLGEGALRATANSFDWTGPVTPPNGTGGISISTVEFRETVTLNNATGGNLLLPFAWTVEGDIPAGTGGSYKYAFSSIQFYKTTRPPRGIRCCKGVPHRVWRQLRFRIRRWGHFLRPATRRWSTGSRAPFRRRSAQANVDPGGVARSIEHRHPCAAAAGLPRRLELQLREHGEVFVRRSAGRIELHVGIGGLPLGRRRRARRRGAGTWDVGAAGRRFAWGGRSAGQAHNRWRGEAA